MSELPLAGKVVVVTGAGGGIGRATALLAAEQGGMVVANDVGSAPGGGGHDAGPAAAVASAIAEAGGSAIADTSDVADWGAAQHLVQTAVEHFGRIDAVINNAGILRDKIFHQMDPSDWDAVLKVHLYGSFNVARAAAGHFRRQQSGAYVHMTSTSGLIGNVGQANYSAAKMGIVGLSRSIALDMSRFNVRSNCVAPFAWTRLVAGATLDPELVAKRSRLLPPESIAPIVVFLASGLSSPITGQVFGVRRNEIYVFSQPRPVRSIHRDAGWTPQTLAEHFKPAAEASLTTLEGTGEVFSWDPI
jgi:NAD(P)-dependent dehydrogenase (short-subunit alcohol dehydrogenase family)